MKAKLMKKFNYWRYLGYDKETLEAYKMKVAEDNLQVFKGALGIATAITSVEFIIVMLFALSGEGVTDSLWTIVKLLFVALILILLVGVAYIFAKNKPNKALHSRIFTTLLLSLWSMLYIIIGTMIDSEDYAVMACGMFLLIQVIFNSYPIENLTFLVCVFVVFAFMAFIFKPPMVFMYDLIDALPFALIGLFLSRMKSHAKWEALINADASVQLEKRKLENEILQSKVSIMISQIQPHFLYNSLETIKVLCLKNPQLAREAMVHFTRYLRANLNSIDGKRSIPFAEEIVHVRNYLFIEKLRFGDELVIEYDIQTKDFMVPPLSLQTIVENAVTHGIRKKEGGGVLTIRTFDTEKKYYVEVTDTGAGFDTSIQKADEQTHIGIANTRVRVEEYGGNFYIESEIGVGTKVTMEYSKGGF